MTYSDNIDYTGINHYLKSTAFRESLDIPNSLESLKEQLLDSTNILRLVECMEENEQRVYQLATEIVKASYRKVTEYEDPEDLAIFAQLLALQQVDAPLAGIVALTLRRSEGKFWSRHLAVQITGG